MASISVTIFVNHNCSCGILLNPKKIEQLPSQYGPGAYQKVLREVIQACVDCANHEKQVYNFIQDGNGKIVITGKHPKMCGVIIVVMWEFDMCISV